MGSPLQFWESLAPYLSHIEDNFLDLESINKLKSIINDPVLIIGAGQGLLGVCRRTSSQDEYSCHSPVTLL